MIKNNIRREGGYGVEMENEDDEPNKYKRINTSNSFVLQSSWVQRAICSYNESHTFLLVYCFDILLYIRNTICDLFYFENKN